MRNQNGARNRNWKGGVSRDGYRYTKRFREKNPEKVLAHDRVRRAKEAGILVPGPCEVCGATNAHAHHEDYSKPLEVRWICQPCHNAVHAGERRPTPRPAPVAAEARRPLGGFLWRGKWRK